MEVEDVYGSYGKIGIVNEIVNVIVKFDKVEIVFGSFDFLSIFLGGVLEFEDIFLLEIGVVVEIKFGVYIIVYLVVNFFYI